jgi:hypothetical protein
LRLPDLLYLFRHLYHSIEGEYLLWVLILLHLLAVLLVVRTWFPRSGAAPDETGLDRRAVLLSSWTLLLSPPTILGILFILDMARHPALYRYTLSCWFLPCLLLPLLTCWLPGRAARVARLVLQGGVVVLAVHHAAGLLPTIDPAKFEQPYPPLAQALDRLARERGSLRGLGGFWVSRSTGWLTREHVVTNQLSPLGEPWFHASNGDWFLSDDRDDLRVPAYQFLLVRSGDGFGPPPAVLALHFGQPAEKIQVGGDQIWLYDALRSPPFERFLRSRLADRLCARRPYTGPAEPACLGRPKPCLTPANAPGNVALEAGQSLEVCFGRPVAGRLLDVGAEFNNRLDLDFYRGKQRLASLPVPMVPWTGASYGLPGIQSRLLPLPAALRDQPWDRIVVRPRTRGEKICLGHLLVFAEEIPGLDEERAPPCQGRMRLEAEEMLPINPGTPFTDDADPTASGGHVRRAAVDFPCSFCFTPLLYLPPGRYRLACALKVGAGPMTDEVARIRVSHLFPSGTMTELSLHGNDFPAAGTPALHELTFVVTEETEGVQLGVSTTGKTPIDLDYLDLIPERANSPGEK